MYLCFYGIGDNLGGLFRGPIFTFALAKRLRKRTSEAGPAPPCLFAPGVYSLSIGPPLCIHVGETIVLGCDDVQDRQVALLCLP